MGNNIFMQSLVYRGVDSGQIAGASDYSKLKKFLSDPLTVKQAKKDTHRIHLLVESGVIPKSAFTQIKNSK